MPLSNETHIKYIWLTIFAMVAGWSGGIAWSAREHKNLDRDIQCVKYDSGVRLAAIETSLKQINVSIMELSREIRGSRKGQNSYAE